MFGLLNPWQSIHIQVVAVQAAKFKCKAVGRHAHHVRNGFSRPSLPLSPSLFFPAHHQSLLSYRHFSSLSVS